MAIGFWRPRRIDRPLETLGEGATVRIVNIGTFLLPVRFSLVGMMEGDGRRRLGKALTAHLTDFQSRALTTGDGLFLDVQSSAHQRMETMVFSGVTVTEAGDTVRLYVSSLAVGFVVVEMDLPDDLVLDLDDEAACERFKAYEGPVTERVEALLGEWCRQIAGAVDPGLLRPVPDSALVQGRLLWWHRVCVDGAPDVEFPGARWYGVPVELVEGAQAKVATGVTNLHTAGRRELINDVVEGLLIATQEWIVVDEAKRTIAKHLLGLSETQAGRLITMDAQYVDVLGLTEEVTLRNLLLGQESRYLTTPRRLIRQAATEAWHVTQEAQELEERTAALRDLFSLHRERIFNNRDDRRNRLIFVFTAVTLIQSVLLWYDFLTGSTTAFGNAPRPAIALVVLFATLATVIGAILMRPSAPRRRARIPHQRPAGDTADREASTRTTVSAGRS